MADQWKQIEALFEQALDQPADARAAWLDEHCPDPTIRREVEGLLRAVDKVDAFLEEPAQIFAADLVESVDAEPQRAGPYRLLQEVGRGGMGTVYLAERDDEQFDQQVAVKLLRSDTARRDLHDRFLAERRILASLSQPNIARLYDGGVTDEGHPYFVMEYIDGRPLDDYCDEKRLSIKERLRLFVTACEAVQHAHQNLVVHRDLKPSNILVTEKGDLKLLDFGIAKLLDENAPSVPVTQTGLRLMTPEYASPEQVKGEPITTASDIYQLGVVLYELLTGHRPYTASGRSVYEIQQAVCEEEPTRPSTAVGQVESVQRGEMTEEITPEMVSQARGMEAEVLQRTLSGDLDAIVLKALRKEPPSRYASAEAFLEDVKRYLASLPVEARQGTVGYRVRKFVQRHRWGVAGVGLFVGMLIVFGVFYTVRVTQERNRAQLEAEKSAEVTAFLMGLFEANDPAEALGDTITARALLERGIARTEEMQDQPVVQAQMLDVMGQVYESLGEYDRADTLYQQALALRRNVLGANHPDVAATMNRWAVLLEDQGEYEQAEALHRKALAMYRAAYGTEHPAIATTLNDLAVVLNQQGKAAESEQLYRAALAQYQRLPDVDEDRRASVMNNLGLLLARQGDHEAGDPYLREALAMRQRLLGDKHPNTVSTRNNLATSLMDRGHYAEAEPLFREVLAHKLEVLGNDHPQTGAIKNNLGVLLERTGRYEEANQFYQEALDLVQRTYGPQHPATLATLSNVASLNNRQGEYAEAESLYREVLAGDRVFFGNDHRYIASTLTKIADIRVQRQDTTMADSLYQEALGIMHEQMPADHKELGVALRKYGDLLLQTNRPDEAVPLLRESLTIYQTAYPDTSHWIAITEDLLGRGLMAQAAYPEAEEHLLHAYEHFKAQYGDTDEATQKSLTHLVELYESWDKPDEAARYGRLLSYEDRS